MKQRISAVCSWTYLGNFPYYLLCLAWCSHQLCVRNKDNNKGANLPQVYKHAADWFFNISLCASLQNAKGINNLPELTGC